MSISSHQNSSTLYSSVASLPPYLVIRDWSGLILEPLQSSSPRVSSSLKVFQVLKGLLISKVSSLRAFQSSGSFRSTSFFQSPSPQVLPVLKSGASPIIEVLQIFREMHLTIDSIKLAQIGKEKGTSQDGQYTPFCRLIDPSISSSASIKQARKELLPQKIKRLIGNLGDRIRQRCRTSKQNQGNTPTESDPSGKTQQSGGGALKQLLRKKRDKIKTFFEDPPHEEDYRAPYISLSPSYRSVAVQGEIGLEAIYEWLQHGAYAEIRNS